MSETTVHDGDGGRDGGRNSGGGLVAQGRHPVNIGHLVMGVAFLGLVGVWALVQGGAVDGSGVRWLLPLPWVFAGVAGLAAAALAARRRAATGTGWAGGRPADGDGTGDDRTS